MLELLLTLSTDSSFNTYHVGNSLTWDSSPSNLGSEFQIQNGWQFDGCLCFRQAKSPPMPLNEFNG